MNILKFGRIFVVKNSQIEGSPIETEIFKETKGLLDFPTHYQIKLDTKKHHGSFINIKIPVNKNPRY